MGIDVQEYFNGSCFETFASNDESYRCISKIRSSISEILNEGRLEFNQELLKVVQNALTKEEYITVEQDHEILSQAFGHSVGVVKVKREGETSFKISEESDKQNH